jgi:hypothetical protein
MEIKIKGTRLPPEEERCRMKRFFDIVLEIDLKRFKELSEEMDDKSDTKKE